MGVDELIIFKGVETTNQIAKSNYQKIQKVSEEGILQSQVLVAKH